MRWSRCITLIPDGVSDPEATATVLAGLTALQGLVGLGRIPGAGARVLVVGGAGGIGSFAVQLAALRGAEVTATTSRAELAWVQALGATGVVDRQQVDLARLASQTAPFDVVFDASGRSGHQELRPLMATHGRVVTVRPLHPDTLRRLGRRDLAAVRTAPNSADLAHLVREVATGRVRACVEHVVEPDQVARAHHLAETEGRGKVVVDLGRSRDGEARA